MRRCLVIFALVALAAAAAVPSQADEGMWMLSQIPELSGTLKAMGLQLTPQQIWDPKTNSGLASAVPWLGGCSSSFVSPDGLIVTNHHCAFGAIQMNSTPEHDYITEGFLAASRAEELPYRPGRVTVFKGYEDVTGAVTASLVRDMKPEERTKAIKRREKELIAECEKGGLRCRLAEMFGGGKYVLFRQLELRDVRLVYAPPRSIGEYGGEVDNWVWPRHTGDYSFMRAYVGPDGKPADYSPDNVPYRPERWLKIATEPLREGDFTFILGYPGRTMRYRVAASVAESTQFYYPQRIALLKDLIAILEKEGARSKGVEIKLASQLKGYYNSYKNNVGMLEGLTRSDLAGRKRAEEAKLTAWIDADPARKAKYGEALPGLDAIVAARGATRDRDLILGWVTMPRSSGLLAAAMIIDHWAEEKPKPDLERDLGYQARDERSLHQRLVTMQRNLDLASDKATLAYLLARAAQLPAGQRISAVDDGLAATGVTGGQAVTALVDRLFTTKLADEKTRLAMFGMDEKALLATGDPMIVFAAALRRDIKAMDNAGEKYEGESVTLEPRLLEALAAWKQAPLYPDANSTLRFTYATVKGYSPRDAVLYLPFTTLHGVIEKNTGVEPFACPKRLLEAAKLGGFGRYEDARLHDVPACFLTTNDITGGNSGSPVMNGKGELVGLAFDGNYESIDSDFLFDPALARTIAVDIRYVLWCSDFVDHADWILKELGLQPLHR
jgi:Peptidase S46